MFYLNFYWEIIMKLLVFVVLVFFGIKMYRFICDFEVYSDWTDSVSYKYGTMEKELLFSIAFIFSWGGYYLLLTPLGLPGVCALFFFIWLILRFSRQDLPDGEWNTNASEVEGKMLMFGILGLFYAMIWDISLGFMTAL